MTPLVLKIKSFIQKQNLCTKGNSVIVGVSGGSDSIGLLTILNELKHELGISLITAHYNHQLRKDSKLDQVLVQQYAEKLNLPFVTENSQKSLKNLKGSLEDLARQERLKFFKKISLRFNANLIALAHTRDDLAETVLMRLIRGSGLYGLRAILPKRTIHDMHIIRPLLEISKKEMLAYLKIKKIKSREDSTNREKIYFRNLVRLELLPLLKKKYNPNIIGTLTNFAHHTTIDYEYLEAQAKAAYHRIKTQTNSSEMTIDLKKLIRLHPALQHMIWRLATSELTKNSTNLETRHIEEIDELISNRPNHSIVHLPQELRLKKSSLKLILQANH